MTGRFFLVIGTLYPVDVDKGADLGDITEHFSLSEFKVSDSFPAVARAMYMNSGDKALSFNLCATILEPVRGYINSTYGSAQVAITSGKRNQALYRALRSKGYKPSRTSDHFWGKGKVACDFIVKTNRGKYSKEATKAAWTFIRTQLPYAYGQAIWYEKKGHCHVSLPTPNNQSEAWIQK